MTATNVELNRQRAQIYQLLSTLYRDELSSALYEKLRGAEFLQGLKNIITRCSLPELRIGLESLLTYLEHCEAPDWADLRYEYADIFLNAGPNPVFPYASFFIHRVPVLMGAVPEVRRYYRQAEVHKSPRYHDLDDHLAVELEFMRFLAEASITGGASAADWEKLRFKFLRDHLMGWALEFCAVLASCAQSDFYRALAEVTLQILVQDRALASAQHSGQALPGAPLEAFAALGEVISTLELDKEYFTLDKGAIPEEPEKVLPTHCYICNALCGKTVKLKDGIITGLAGLEGDIRGGGRLCPKGGSSNYHVYSAYRLKTPLIRENGRFRKASWDEALDRIAQGLKSLDPHTVGFLRGNDFNNWLTEGVMNAYGAHICTHRTMCDNPMRQANEHNLNDKRPWLNYQQSDYILNFGHNEVATSQSQRKLRLLREAVTRGAKLVVFDPRRSETAALATEWIPIKSSTDGAVAMAMCHVIVKNELYNKEFVENWTFGFEDFKRRLLGEEDGLPRTPEWAEKISGVPAATIERIALEIAQSRHPGVVTWTGVAQSPNAFHGTMAVWALNALLGTFDAPGGPSLPYKRKLSSPWGPGQEKPPVKPKDKMNQLRMWAGWASGYFPEDVAQRRFQGFLCYYGDAVLSWTNREAAEKAIKELKFKATIDSFMSNTAVLCDVVLPGVSWFEQSRVYAEWLYDAAIHLTQQVIDPLYDNRSDFFIFTELAKRLGLGQYFPWTDIEDAMRNQLAGTPWSLEELKAKGYIITDQAEYYKYQKWGGFNPPEGYGSSGKTITGKYNFKNPVAEEKGVDPLPDYRDPYEDWPLLKPDEDYPLILGNFRFAEHEHCSTQNNFYLMSQVGKNPIWINYLDAKARGIENHDPVRVTSPWGQTTTEAYVTWNIRQGTTAMGGGFGHIRGLEADPKYPQFGGCGGVGDLMPPNVTDVYAGTAPLKLIKVQVAKA
ncbi:MAG: molybdopterin-dependent oxidoreductase [Deltaproteobacteria bacterium]|nr:molybdopterin-dependent oxidoreductase [Deltaproteobacteria bacterium]